MPKSLKRPRILCKCDKLSRVLEIEIGGKVLHTPAYFPSISSYGVKFPPSDMFYFLKFHSHPCVLVSAYDLYFLKEGERKRLLSMMKEYRKKGFLFLDSGLFESSWIVGKTWDIAAYKNLIFNAKFDFYSSFDVFRDQKIRDQKISDEEFAKLSFDNIIESSAFLNNVVFVPILHEETAEKLVNLVGKFTEEYPKLCGCVAVAERDCGKSIIERAETILRIREVMNNNNYQNILHILGCGNPKSIMLFSYCGADSFDSLDWLKHVINPSDNSIHDFSQLDLINCKCHVCTDSNYRGTDYLQKTLLHNLLYYRIFLDNMQSLIRNGIMRPYLDKHIGKNIIEQVNGL